MFRSVDDLERRILEAVERHNEAPRPYIWTTKATDILAKAVRARASLNVPKYFARPTLVMDSHGQ